MDKAKAEMLIRSVSNLVGVDPDLACAIAEKESAFDEWAVRYEPGWKYVYNTEMFARKCNISALTEERLQMHSFGMMQIMGTVAREQGFNGNLLELTKPEIGLKFACLKLRDLSRRYPKQADAISSYNQGSPRKLNGKYLNQKYVDDVLVFYAKRNPTIVR